LERKLTAILCADVFGYSRLMGEDEEATLRTLSAYRKIIDQLIKNHRGRFVNSAGDSVLAEFLSVVEAVNCALEIQNALKAENTGLPPERRMEFRIGINLGDVMVEGEQIYGDGVNVAARLENRAYPGGICISGIVHDQVKRKLTLSYQDLGAQQVKNIAEPVHVWRVVLDGDIRSRRTAGRFGAKNYWRGGVLSLTGLAIIIGTILIVQHLSFKPPRTSASIPAPEKPALLVPNIPSIAVLPFTNVSGDSGQEYFSDGLTDLLIIRLSKVPGMFVIARASSFSYKGRAVTVQQVGRQLGVRTVLEGSVLKTGDRVRITAQLADATSGANLWAQNFDQPVKDIFAMQDEIVRSIVTTLRLLFKVNALHLGSVVRESLQTDNLDAFDASLRCMESFWKFTKDDNAAARQMCEKSIALDPRYAAAYQGLGWTYENDVAFQWSKDPAGDLERASSFAHKALALDDSNTMALNLISDNDRMGGKFEEAVTEAQRAVVTDPNNSFVYWFLALALDADGKPDDALRKLQEATRLDPALADLFAMEVGWAYLQEGQYQQAISASERCARSFSTLPGCHLGLAVGFTELGRDGDARAEAAEVMRLNPHFTLGTKSPYKDVAWARRVSADLRKAGLK
jgi:adenylate cyclase